MSKFELGKVVSTNGVHNMCCVDKEFSLFVNSSFQRYSSGDWGEMCDEDKEQNEQALEEGERLMGSYENKEHDWKIWIITEWDRSVTTILFPEEY
ncbi:MAG: hypothetical protein IIY89_07115 [Clostridia bacterium]|nr:hypothetical protein [Clostridia bacterium]